MGKWTDKLVGKEDAPQVMRQKEEAEKPKTPAIDETVNKKMVALIEKMRAGWEWQESGVTKKIPLINKEQETYLKNLVGKVEHEDLVHEVAKTLKKNGIFTKQEIGELANNVATGLHAIIEYSKAAVHKPDELLKGVADEAARRREKQNLQVKPKLAADAEFLKQLKEMPPGEQINELEKYKIGSKGKDVAAIQALCNEITKENITVDGIYGPQTKGAVEKALAKLKETKPVEVAKKGAATATEMEDIVAEAMGD